jgi:hypothetical protein
MKPATAGALQDARTQTRLFQYWDPCGGAPHNGRSNVNPNAIDLQSRGLPLLLDGMPTLPAGLLHLDETALRHYLPEGLVEGLRRYLGQPETPEGLTRTLRHAVAGGIGDSNSLVVDGENWYVPLRSVGGQGLAVHDAGCLQVIESDSADYYRDRYDVTKATRISALVDGEIVLCLDDWASETPHRLTWQAFTWPEASQADGRVCADIGGLLQLDFLPGPGPRTVDFGAYGKAGIQICYEIVFSGEVVDPANRPDYIFNPSNDGWFGAALYARVAVHETFSIAARGDAGSDGGLSHRRLRPWSRGLSCLPRPACARPR